VLRDRTAEVHRLLTSSQTAFVLVTGFNAVKIEEARYFERTLKKGGYTLSAIIVNRAFPLWGQNEIGIENLHTNSEMNARVRVLIDYYNDLRSFYSDQMAAFESFQREVQNAIAPYMGLTLSEVNAGRVLIEATKIATKHRIRIPSEWMVVFKAILTTEGMGRSLDPGFDLLSSGQELVKEMVKSQYSLHAIRNDLIWSAKDVLSLFQTLPRQIRWMFRKLNSNDFAFEIKSEDLREISQKIEKSGRRTSLSMVIGSLLIASSIALQFATEHQFLGLPSMSVVYLAVAIFLLLRLWWI
jgi:ubiquinone biosynthesis protein